MQNTRLSPPVSPCALLIAALFFTGCVAEDNPSPPDGRDDSFTTDGKTDTAGIAEGSPQALGVLAVVNSASRSELELEVGLAPTVAELIAVYRDGTDEEAGKQFESLAELDAVPFVGPISFRQLLEYAIASGYVSNSCSSDGDCATGTCVLGACSAMSDQYVERDAALPFERADIVVDDSGTPWFMASKNIYSYSNRGRLFRLEGSGWSSVETLPNHGDMALVKRPGAGVVVVARGTDSFKVANHPRCRHTNGRPEQFAASYSPTGTLFIVYNSDKKLSLCNAATGDNELVTTTFSSFGTQLALRFDAAGTPQVLVQNNHRLKRYRKHLDKWHRSHLFTGPGTHKGSLQLVNQGLSTHVFFSTRSFGSSPSVGDLHVRYLHVTDEGVVATTTVPISDRHGAWLSGPASAAGGSAFAIVAGRQNDGRQSAQAIRVGTDGHAHVSIISNLEASTGTRSYSLAAGPGGVLYQATADGFVRTIQPL